MRWGCLLRCGAVCWYGMDSQSIMPSENNELAGGFDGLRRLLVLKRREVPPPGFFNNFASRVICRIEAEELAREEMPWWRRSLGLSTARILAGANLLTLCGLTFVGVSLYLVLSGDVEPPVIAGVGQIPSRTPLVAGIGTVPGDLPPNIAFSPSMSPSVSSSGISSTASAPAAVESISGDAVNAERDREEARALFKLGGNRALNAEPVSIPTYRMIVPR